MWYKNNKAILPAPPENKQMPSPEETEADFAKTDDYIARQDTAKSFEACKFAHRILDEILAFVRPGIRESEVKDFTLARYEAHEIERPWHLPYIRFGEHTLMTYRDKAKEDRVLAEEDIAFVDIGTVKYGIEGDAGRTIVFGSNPVFEALRDGSETIFRQTVDYWKQNNPSGEELYKYITDLAEKSGFLFNLDPAGHLIGTFPHRGWKRGINHFPHTIDKGVWVLEIQIRHPELPYGAFYEDILI